MLSEAEHGYTAGSVEVSMDYFLYYTFSTKKSPFFDKQVDFPETRHGLIGSDLTTTVNREMLVIVLFWPILAPKYEVPKLNIQKYVTLQKLTAKI